MIDVDQFEEQLDLALTDELRGAIGLATAATPTPARPRPTPHKRTERQRLPRTGSFSAQNEVHTHDIASLLRAGRAQDADRLIAEKRAVADHNGTAADRDDAALWTTMQTLRDGRVDDALAGASVGQRFWIVLDWGDENQRYELLDECRERAYCRNDLDWRARLALLCARMGRNDEAGREFDSCVDQLAPTLQAHDPETQAILTELIEAATVIKDAARVRLLQRGFDLGTSLVVVDSRAHVCKGASARYQALVSAASRRWDDCDRAFESAVETNRAIGAFPLVARTLHDWGSLLADRGDPRAWDCLKESAELARRLHMTGAISGMP